MDSPAALFSLFQMIDSFFPSGSFAYSWGLETYVDEGLVGNVKELEGFLSAYLRGVVARCDALVLKMAHEAADAGDLGEIFRLDGMIHSMKTAREAREGSVQIGGQILRVMAGLYGRPILGRYLNGIESGAAKGHHPVAFGVVCNALGIGKRDSVAAFLYQTASGIVSAGVRLVPLGHMDGQRALRDLTPRMAGIADEVVGLGEDDLSSFAPGIEIRAMRHEDLYSRLFRS